MWWPYLDNNITFVLPAHAASCGSNRTTAHALPAVSGRHKETDRGADRTGVPRTFARRPQSLHLRRIGS